MTPDLPPKLGGKNEAQHMSLAVDTYHAWNQEGGVWRSASGDMRVEDMDDKHVRKVQEQVRARARSLASLYVWGVIYLNGADNATQICALFVEDPMKVLERTELWKALEARA